MLVGWKRKRHTVLSADSLLDGSEMLYKFSVFSGAFNLNVKMLPLLSFES